MLLVGAAVAGLGRRGAAADPSVTLVLLTPGAVIDGPKRLPAGWTHLVIKSTPRLASGDVGTLPAIGRRTATLLRTALLVEVAPAREGRFVLRRVGVGLCTPIKGVDTVISSATIDKLGAPFGVVERVVLGKAEEELSGDRLRAVTPSFALYSAPTLQKIGTAHEPVCLQYALLVEPRTGELRTLLWSQVTETARRTPPAQVDLLAPGLVTESAVDVRAERLLSAVPVNWSFALTALPCGTPLPTTAAVRRWCLHDAFTPAEAARFEADLRALLSAAPGR
jgi:hypothetical protein